MIKNVYENVFKSFLLVCSACVVCAYVSFSLVSCRKDGAIPANALILNVDKSFTQDANDPSLRTWFMVSDLNNNVIGIKEASNLNTLIFNYDDSVSGEKVYLTLITYSRVSGEPVCHATSYLVPRKSVYNFNVESPMAVLGASFVTIKNLDSKPFRCLFTLGNGNNGLSTFGSNALSLELGHVRSPDNLFISIQQKDQEVPYFSWIKGVEINKQYVIDFTKFDPMPAHIISLPANDGAGYTISGSEHDSDMVHPISYSLISEGDHSSATVFAPETGFAKYITDMQFYQGNAHYEISTLTTTIPTVFTQPSFDITIAKIQPDDYSIETKGHYDYAITYFANDDFTFGWSVYNPEGVTIKGSLPEVPAEITKIFSSATRQNLLLIQASIRDDGSTNGYDDFIKTLGTPQKKEYAFTSLKKTAN